MCAIIRLIISILLFFSTLQVVAMELTMKVWSQTVDKLLLKHKWLLLFSIPKLLKLSQLLRNAFYPDHDAKQIMEEIGFLFCSNIQARAIVVLAIKVITMTAGLYLVGRCGGESSRWFK